MDEIAHEILVVADGDTSTYEYNRLLNAIRVGIDKYLTTSREKSLALTKLDECMMWLDKAGD